MVFRLLVIDGPDKGRVFDLPSGPAHIGRDGDAEIQLNDRRVSRRHCLIEVTGDTVELTDLDSSGGTFVNSDRVVVRTVESEDVILVGNTSLCLRTRAVDAETTLQNVAEDTHQSPGA